MVETRAADRLGDDRVAAVELFDEEGVAVGSVSQMGLEPRNLNRR
jgi:hypothetical protein